MLKRIVEDIDWWFVIVGSFVTLLVTLSALLFMFGGELITAALSIIVLLCVVVWIGFQLTKLIMGRY